MCTVTFVPRPHGCLVAMNRDELFRRPPATAPRWRDTPTGRVCHPSEPGGGTWIGVTERGVIAVLLNWYSAPVRPVAQTRGTVVPALLAQPSVRRWSVCERPRIQEMNPFRVIVLDPLHRTVEEGRWDGTSFRVEAQTWERRFWFSSGYEETQTAQIRAETFRSASREPSDGSNAWVRRWHASHLPSCGPFSICAHRADAGTVSYTEIVVKQRKIRVRYTDGPPCLVHPAVAVEMGRR
jgi:hypothetical protein